MKISKLVLIPLFCIIFSPVLSGQDLVFRDSDYEFKKEQRPAVMVRVDVPPKTLKGAWKDFLKDEYDIKLKGFGFLANKDQLTAEEVDFKAISDEKVDFYSQFEEKKNEETVMYIFARHGYDFYVGPEKFPSEYDRMRSIVEKFVGGFVPDFYQKEAEELQEKISDINDEISDKESTIADNEEEIKSLREEIDALREEVNAAKKRLDARKIELDNKKSALDQINQAIENIVSSRNQ